MRRRKAGAQFMTGQETIDQKLARLQPMFFDPNVDPIVTNKTPGAGKDILQASANNLYSGVSMADLKGFNEKYGLNSRLVKQNGKLVEEVYESTAGTASTSPRSSSTSKPPSRLPKPPMAKALDALIKFYRTGEDADREAYDIAWVQDKVSPVDTINGFIEVYLDPRGIKGSWEGLVFYVNQEKTAAHQDASPPTRSGSRTTCRGTRSTARPACRASSPTPSTSSSRPATPVR